MFRRPFRSVWIALGGLSAVAFLVLCVILGWGDRLIERQPPGGNIASNRSSGRGVPRTTRKPSLAEAQISVIVRKEDGDVVGVRLYRGDDDALAKMVLAYPEVEKLSIMDSGAISAVGLECLTRLHRLREFTIVHRHPQFTDETLRALTRVASLETLDIGATAVTDAGLVYLRDLPNLRDLDLTNTRVTDRGVGAFVGPDSPIERLCLDGTDITGTVFPAVARMPKLTHLSLRFMVPIENTAYAELVSAERLESLALPTAVTDEALADVSKMRLRRLDLKYCDHVSDRGVAALSSMQTLEWLRLLGTATTDQAFASLAQLSELQYLHVGTTQIEGHGLRHLSRLKHLSELNISSTRVQTQYAAALKDIASLEILDCSLTPFERDGNWKKLAALVQLKELIIDLHQPQREELGLELPNTRIYPADSEFW